MTIEKNKLISGVGLLLGFILTLMGILALALKVDSISLFEHDIWSSNWIVSSIKLHRIMIIIFGTIGLLVGLPTSCVALISFKNESKIKLLLFFIGFSILGLILLIVAFAFRSDLEDPIWFAKEELKEVLKEFQGNIGQNWNF